MERPSLDLAMSRRGFGATLLGGAALATAACGGTRTRDDGVEELKLAHIAAPDTAYDNLAKDFKARVEEATEGRFEVFIYPAGQLGVDRELMESLQNGNVDLTVITASDINQFVPDMAVQICRTCSATGTTCRTSSPVRWPRISTP